MKADRILVLKSARRMTIFWKGKVIREYRISLGRTPVGPKTQEGDGKTPEGLYRIDYRNANSKFHLSLHVSYPNPTEVARAKQAGVSPGGDIMIHGLPNGMGAIGKGHLIRDWTDGCIAVTNEEIREIWDAIELGTPIEIRP